LPIIQLVLPLALNTSWNWTKARRTRSVAPLAWRATSRNVINDHCEFEIGLKRTIGPRRKPFSPKGHTTTPTSARKSSADRPPIAVQVI
jgi:hypothetical protein